MTEAEYNENLEKIENDYKIAKSRLFKEFALSNALYKKGDIIKETRWTILVDKISVYKAFGLPEPVYTGVRLNKDLTPNKKGEIGSIYGHHLVELVKSA